MPTVFKREGYRFYFFSNEGDPREPTHVHVRSGDDESKVLVAAGRLLWPRALGLMRRN